MSKFENWIESHSNKEFVEFHRILDIEKSDKYDKKIAFYVTFFIWTEQLKPIKRTKPEICHIISIDNIFSLTSGKRAANGNFFNSIKV